MDKREIVGSMTSMEEEITNLSSQLGELKDQVTKLLEENQFLHIENHHLRRRLELLLGEESSISKKKRKQIDIGDGYDTLARLYKEGFHVCNLRYGSVRTDGDCLFCMAIFEPALEK